jgi:hypothetical protein
VVRSIGADPPTLLVDEADTLWGTRKQADTNEDLRSLLNAGQEADRDRLAPETAGSLRVVRLISPDRSSYPARTEF